MPQRVTLRSKVNRPRLERAGRSIIRAHGVAAISMRAVATELGVTPMALYSVVGDAAELRRLVIDAALVGCRVAARERHARRTVARWALAACPVLARSPGLAAACLEDWPSLREGCRILEELLGVAADADATGPAQLAIAHAVLVETTLGAIATQAWKAPRRTRSIPALALRPEREGRFPAPYPRLAHCEPALRSLDPNRRFELGLDGLLDGMLPDR